MVYNKNHNQKKANTLVKDAFGALEIFFDKKQLFPTKI